MPKRKLVDPKVLTLPEMRLFVENVRPTCPEEGCGSRAMEARGVGRTAYGGQKYPAMMCLCKSCNRSTAMLPTREALKNAGVTEDRIRQLGFLPVVDEVLRGLEKPAGVAAVRFMHGNVDVLRSDGYWTLHQSRNPDRALDQLTFEGRMRTF